MSRLFQDMMPEWSCAPTSLCRRRRAGQFRPAFQENRRLHGRPEKIFKESRTNFLPFSKFSYDLFFSHPSKIVKKISTQQKWHRRHADKLSAEARRSTKISGGAHKLSAAVAQRGRRTALCLSCFTESLYFYICHVVGGLCLALVPI